MPWRLNVREFSFSDPNHLDSCHLPKALSPSNYLLYPFLKLQFKEAQFLELIPGHVPLDITIISKSTCATWTHPSLPVSSTLIPVSLLKARTDHVFWASRALSDDIFFDSISFFTYILSDRSGLSSNLMAPMKPVFSAPGSGVCHTPYLPAQLTFSLDQEWGFYRHRLKWMKSCGSSFEIILIFISSYTFTPSPICSSHALSPNLQP